MTSTNDGKDVKSYQTSGQKGKSYYIELYKSIDARLSAECALPERVGHVCDAWRRVHSLCLHSAPATHPHLLSWLQRHTHRTVLHNKWSKEEQDSLEEAIDAFIEETKTGRACKDGVSPLWESQLLQRALWFKRWLSNPWGHPVLRLLLDPKGETPTDEQILEWLKEERGPMFETRLRQLAASKCGDLAASLASAVMDRARACAEPAPDHEIDEPTDKPKPEPSKPTFADILTSEAGFTTDVWELVTDIEFVLLHKGDSRSKCIELAKQTPLRRCYQLVDRLQGRLEAFPSEKKLWKNAKEVATLIAQVVIARCMVVPVCAGAARTALYCCARALVRLLPPARLQPCAAALAAPAATAAHLHTLAAATRAQRGAEMTPFVCELYVRAITTGMNELERLKLNNEKETEARQQEQMLANWFIELSNLLAASIRLRCECALTAFSVHPARALYAGIQQAPPLPRRQAEQDAKEETTSEFGSWATDSRTQTNLVKTSETLNIKQTSQQANVLSTATLSEGEALGLSPELCQDLAVLLAGPRVKTLSWDMDRELLLENCRTYMERTHGGTKALTTELKYLNLDPRSYQHLPEEDDAENDAFYGIEKGYEHLVEVEQEEIWQDAYSDPEKTESVSSCTSEIVPVTSKKKKKKKKLPALSSEEDSDPLSLVAEAKRSEKKKERPLSKERSKEKKERKKSKPKDGAEKKETSREKRKEGSEPKEKKERKPRKKKPKEEMPIVEHKPGSLSSLIGMKVAKIKIPEGQFKKTETVPTPCITDSDYDSQGKSSLASLNSEGNDPDVLFDGLYNMDDYKSPEKGDPLADGNTYSSEISVANGRVAINTTSSRTKDNRHKMQSSPSINTLGNLTTTPKAVIREDLKRSITKLIECRRQKSLLEETQIFKSAGSSPVCSSPASTYSDRSVTPKPSPIVKPHSDISAPLIKSPNAIIRPEFPEPAIISPKAVEVPEIPKVYIDKKQIESLKELKQEFDGILNAKYSNNPIIQYTQKQPVRSCESSFQQYLQQRQQCFAQQQEIQANQNNYSASVSHSSREDPNKDIFTDFLRELQQSINAGTGANKKPKATTKTKTAAKKVLKPISRVPPVIPNFHQTEPGPSSQSAKPTIQSTKKVDNQLNTFARLSYMHKNKQNDIKFNKQTTELSSQEQQKILSRCGDDQKSAKLKYLQAKGDLSILRVGQNAHSLLKDDGKVVIRKVEKPSSVVYEHPLLSNMLYANNSPTVNENPRNETHGTVPNQPEVPTTKGTALSDKDQNDLLLLLRQKSKLTLTALPSHVNSDVTKISNVQYSKNTGESNTAHLNHNQVTCVNKSVIRPTEFKSNKVQQYEGCKVKNMLINSIPAAPNNTMDHKSKKVIKTNNNYNKIVTLSKVPNAMPTQPPSINVNHIHGSLDNIPQTTNLKKVTKLSVTESERKETKTGTSKKPNTTIIKVPNPSQIKTLCSNVLPPSTVQPQDGVNPQDGANPSQVEPQDWARVMDALLSHKTPSLGPNALDVALKKDSFAKTALRNQRIVRNKEKVLESQPKQASFTQPSVAPPAHTNVNTDQSAVTDLSIKKLIQKIDSQKVTIETLKRPVETQKSLPSEAVKGKDPFISGIPNSDYDLIEELMDDELRKEIGELSSDEETYQAPSVVNAKVIKTPPSAKCTNVIKHVPQTVQANVSRSRSSSSVQNVRESIIQSNSRVIKTYEAPKSKTVQSNIANTKPQADNKPKILENVALPPSKINLFSPAASQKKACNTEQNVNRNNVNLVDARNMLLTATPVGYSPVQSNPVTSKVVLIGSEVIYDPFAVASVQTPITPIVTGLRQVNQTSYVAVNTTPNITVYQTTQFAAPLVNQVIIGNAMTVPTTERQAETITMHYQQPPDIPCRQTDTSKPFEPTQTCTNESIDNLISDNAKAELENNLRNELKCNVTHEVTPRPVVNTEKETKTNLDINFNKNSERRVLSEVQDKQTVNIHENVDAKVTKIQKSPLDSDLKEKVITDQEEITQIDLIPQKQPNVLPDNITEQMKEEALERIMMKRLAILDRTTLHISKLPAIPLDYVPLKSPKQKIANVSLAERSSLQKNIFEICKENTTQNTVASSSALNNKVEPQKDNLSTGNSKENDRKSTQRRRILLRSSNDLKTTATANLQDQRNPKVGRKTKVRLKPDPKKKNGNVESKVSTDNKNAKEVDTDSQKRTSKRILDKKRNSLKKSDCEEDTSEKVSHLAINNENVTKQVFVEAKNDIKKVETLQPNAESLTNIANDTKEVPSIDKKSEIIDTSVPNDLEFGLIDIEDALLGSKISKTMKSDLPPEEDTEIHEDIDKPRPVRVKKKPQKYANDASELTNEIPSNTLTISITRKKTGKTKFGIKPKASNTDKQKVTEISESNTTDKELLTTTKSEVFKQSMPGVSTRATSINPNHVTVIKKHSDGLPVELNDDQSSLNEASGKIEVIAPSECIESSSDKVKSNDNSQSGIPTRRSKSKDNEHVTDITESVKTMNNVLPDDSLLKSSVKADSTLENKINATANMTSNLDTPKIVSQNHVLNESHVKTQEVIQRPEEFTKSHAENSLSADSYADLKDKIVLEELPSPPNDPSKKCVRIKLPNGKTFKATVFGKMHVSFDTIFADPALKSILLSNLTDSKRYTVNIKQVSTAAKNDPKKIVDARIEELNILPRNVPKPRIVSQNMEVVNLLSDDEEETVNTTLKSTQTFKTEFGQYKSVEMNENDFENHQRKLQQKCIVKLMKMIQGECCSQVQTAQKLNQTESSDTKIAANHNLLDKIKKTMADMDKEIAALDDLDELPKVTLNNQVTISSDPIVIDDDTKDDHQMTYNNTSLTVVDGNVKYTLPELKDQINKEKTFPVQQVASKTKDDRSLTAIHQIENDANGPIVLDDVDNKDTASTRLNHQANENTSVIVENSVHNEDTVIKPSNIEVENSSSVPIVAVEEDLTAASSQVSEDASGCVTPDIVISKDNPTTELQAQIEKVAESNITLDNNTKNDLTKLTIKTDLNVSSLIEKDKVDDDVIKTLNQIGDTVSSSVEISDSSNNLPNELNKQSGELSCLDLSNANASCHVVLDNESDKVLITKVNGEDIIAQTSKSEIEEAFSNNQLKDNDASCFLVLGDESDKDLITKDNNEDITSMTSKSEIEEASSNNQLKYNDSSCSVVLDDESDKDLITKDNSEDIISLISKSEIEEVTSNKALKDNDTSCPVVLAVESDKEDLLPKVNSEDIIAPTSKSESEEASFNNQLKDNDASCPVVLNDESDNEDLITIDNSKDTISLTSKSEIQEASSNNQLKDNDASCPVVLNDESDNENLITIDNSKDTISLTSKSEIEEASSNNQLKDNDASCPVVLIDESDNEDLITIDNSRDIISPTSKSEIEEASSHNKLKDNDASCPVVLNDESDNEDLITIDNSKDIISLTSKSETEEEENSCVKNTIVPNESNTKISEDTSLTINKITDEPIVIDDVDDKDCLTQLITQTEKDIDSLIEIDRNDSDTAPISKPIVTAPVIPDVIEIDDSSNDSVDNIGISSIANTLLKEIASVLKQPLLAKPKETTTTEVRKIPEDDIDELKKLLLEDLGVKESNEETKTVASESDDDLIIIEDNTHVIPRPGIVTTKKCYVRLVNCDVLAEKYLKKKLINQKYDVNLVRCDHLIPSIVDQSDDDNELEIPSDDFINLEDVDADVSLNLEPKRSRTGSFSLLNELPVYFDDSEIETSSLCGRTSPVMEVFDAIADLQRPSKVVIQKSPGMLDETSSDIFELDRSSPLMEIFDRIASCRRLERTSKIFELDRSSPLMEIFDSIASCRRLERTSKVNVAEKNDCRCEWSQTKRDMANLEKATNDKQYPNFAAQNNESVLIDQQEVTEIIGQLTESNHQMVPTLQALTVKIFHCDEILSRLRPYTYISKKQVQSPSHTLKRKLRYEEDKGAASKILKAVMHKTLKDLNKIASDAETFPIEKEASNHERQITNSDCSEQCQSILLDPCPIETVQLNTEVPKVDGKAYLDDSKTSELEDNDVSENNDSTVYEEIRNEVDQEELKTAVDCGRTEEKVHINVKVSETVAITDSEFKCESRLSDSQEVVEAQSHNEIKIGTKETVSETSSVDDQLHTKETDQTVTCALASDGKVDCEDIVTQNNVETSRDLEVCIETVPSAQEVEQNVDKELPRVTESVIEEPAVSETTSDVSQTDLNSGKVHQIQNILDNPELSDNSKNINVNSDTEAVDEEQKQTLKSIEKEPNLEISIEVIVTPITDSENDKINCDVAAQAQRNVEDSATYSDSVSGVESLNSKDTDQGLQKIDKKLHTKEEFVKSEEQVEIGQLESKKIPEHDQQLVDFEISSNSSDDLPKSLEITQATTIKPESPLLDIHTTQEKEKQETFVDNEVNKAVIDQEIDKEKEVLQQEGDHNTSCDTPEVKTDNTIRSTETELEIVDTQNPKQSYCNQDETKNQVKTSKDVIVVSECSEKTTPVTSLLNVLEYQIEAVNESDYSNTAFTEHKLPKNESDLDSSNKNYSDILDSLNIANEIEVCDSNTNHAQEEISCSSQATTKEGDVENLDSSTESKEESEIDCLCQKTLSAQILDHGYAFKVSCLNDCKTIIETSDSSPAKSDKDGNEVVLNGIEYEDPVIGTCYVFPIAESPAECEVDSDIYNEGTEEIIQVIQEIREDGTVDSVTLETKEIAIEEPYLTFTIPKLTYSKYNTRYRRNQRTLKRKIDMNDIVCSRKRYKKGKNIDYPKFTASAVFHAAYSKEYKQVFDYCSSLKFSYSQPFHKEFIDVEEIIKDWPLQGEYADFADEIDSNDLLFSDLDIQDYDITFDPMELSLAEELEAEYKETDEPSSNVTETNFNMGFGEGSDRVIQNLEDVDDDSKFSAATLSDVKQTQPFLLSEDYEDINEEITEKTREYQIKQLRRYITYIQMKDKVRSFFEKTSVELKYDWMRKQKIKTTASGDERELTSFPFDLYNATDFIEPPPADVLVQVVQVGQLPVSAAAQNPVTCDPRVTQVSDASPSQCSVDNSPQDDSQPTIKTEYTELTTADLSNLPMVQEYAQQHQALPMDSQEQNNMSMTDENIPIETEIKSVVKIELMEETEVKEEQRECYENNGSPNMDRYVNNGDYSIDSNAPSATPVVDSEQDFQALYNSTEKQNITETYSTQQQQQQPQTKQQNGTSEKTDQIAHAMNAAGITTISETMTNTTRAQALVNILSQKLRQGSVAASQSTTNNFSKTTSINAMSLQQALAQILPQSLNQNASNENGQQNQNTPQVLHIVQGKNASGGSQITLVDNSQQSVINGPNATPLLHIVQNKSGTAVTNSNGAATQQTNSFGGLSLVDAGLQQGGNQLLHIVNTGNQKNSSATGQLLKRVNLLTNLANVQGSNEQKMVQFVCKSADGKAIQLNAAHQRSMVLRLQPIETPNVQTTPKPTDNQELSPNSNSANALGGKDSASQQEIKSRSVYEENYAKFIQNSSTKTTIPEKSTSLPKFNQAFGKPVFQDGTQKQNDMNQNNTHLSVNTNSEGGECQSSDNAINLDHIGQISSPPLLLRKSPAQTTQSQANIVQQIKQTITPMNIQTMHGGVIYTRQIPVNIGGGQTINLITVPSTELVDENGQKQQPGSQNEMEPSIIKIVPQNQTSNNNEISSEDGNAQMNVQNENNQNPQPQPVLTQMRIKLPMLSKTPQMVSGARVVRPSFFQIQRNVIGGTNQPVYQQLVLTAAPPLGQQTIRLPQTQTSRQIKVPTENQSSAESQMSSSTLEQLREFDMVLEQVKERSSVPPSSNPSSSFSKLHTSSSDTTDGSSASSTSTETTQQVLYSIGNNHQPLNVAYVNRKATVTTPTTSTYVRSPDSSGIVDSPTSSTHVQIPHTVTTESSSHSESSSQPKPKVSSKSKSRPKASSNPPSSLKINTVPPKTSAQKPLEDEQTTQRILYILAEYKEQVENSPDKDKPAPRRRSNPPSNPSGSSKRKKSSSGSRRHGRDMSPIHGEDTCRTMGSEDSSCGTSQGDCNESCLDSHSPQDSPRKVVRKLTFEPETPPPQPRPQPQRNVIVADGQTITVARGTAGKPATAVLMPANYILPVSMVKGGQQIAIVTNRGPKLLTVGGGEGGATNALLLQRLIGPAGLKPVLARPGVRHVRLPTAALHNLQAFNLATATTVQPPDSTASPAPAPTPPELVDTRATSSPWTDRDCQDVKPERGSSPEGSEPWNLPSSGDPHDYTYEETVRADNLDRTVLDPIPDRYSPDMEAQRIFDKMFDVESKKSYLGDSPRCVYDIDASDCDDKPYHQVVQKKDGHRQHRLTHVSAAALRHKYAILEHELRLQKSLSEECEDLGVDSPSASELFPEAELLFAASPAHDHTQDQAHHSHTPQPTLLNQSGIPQPDMDDQIATDQLLTREMPDDQQQEQELQLGLDVGMVGVGAGLPAALDAEEFARAHPNTTFHSEPTDAGEVQPFTIAGLKGRHITSTIFHSNRAPATVLMTAPQTTVISQASADNAAHNTVKYDIDNMINSLPSANGNNINLSSVLVKDEGLTRFDSILNDSRELHLSHTASAIVHSAGNATQVIRRVCYDEDKRDNRFLMDEPDALIAGDDAKMIAEDSSRDATLESMAGDVDDDRSSPERHAELFWESNSASERSESRRPLDFSSDSEKCCKSPSYDEANSTDSSGVGTHMRLDSVIKDARGIERSGSADGSSADDTHPPLRTYPPKRMYHPLDGEERSLSGKTRAGERSPDSLEVRRRASGRGVVKRGCHCCNGSPAPTRPKKSRQRKPTMDFTN